MTFELQAYSCSPGSFSCATPKVRLVREEHHDEVGRGLELPPVPLGRELRDVLADLARVVCEVELPLRVVRGLERVEVRRERRLRIDHDVLAARDADDEVGPQRALLGRRRRLGDEVTVLDHPGVLDDVPQLRFAPAPAHVRRAQGVREVPGALGERRDLRLEVAVRLLPDALDALELLVHPLQRVLERAYVAGEPRVRELEEPRAVRVERLRGDRLDGHFEPLVERVSLRLECRLGRGELPLERDHLLDPPPPLGKGGPQAGVEAERAGREPECEAEYECDDHRVEER